MSVSFYMDVHVPYPVTAGLVSRKVDVITAQWDGTTQWSDPDLLDRAMALSRVLVTQDEDLLAEAAQRQRTGRDFAGVVYAHQQRITIAKFIEDLHLIGTVCEPEELANRVEFLPL